MLKSFAHLSPTTRFRAALAAILALAFVLLSLAPPRESLPPEFRAPSATGVRLDVYFHPDCPHCHAAIAFLKSQAHVSYALHDVSAPEGRRRLDEAVSRLGVAREDVGVPLIVAGDRYLVGFDSPATTGRELLALAAGARPDARAPSGVDLPLVGHIDFARHSLPALAIMLGLADGFNPCAMWVLVYMISLIAGVQERGRILLLVGVFVGSSGVLYFLFMTAWLNAFLVIGYVRPLTILMALVAIGFGVDFLYEIVRTRGEVVCEVADAASRQKTMRKVRAAMSRPLSLVGLAAMVGLAFTVNSLEFACSAALPAVYTHVLASANLSTVAWLGYIALYVLFFMLDDVVVFSLAAFSTRQFVGTRYSAVSRGVGGVLLIGLGVWMIFR